jgi:hypothetical protein
MTFSPRLPPEILSQLLARVVASNEAGLTDVSEGGVLATILGSVAQEFSNLELRLYNLNQNFFLQTQGADLDRRIEEFPSSFARRLRASAASGGAFRVTRTDDLATRNQPHIVPARTLVVQASSNPDVSYTNLAPIVFDAGQLVSENNAFVARSTGTISNLANVLAIDTVISSYAQIVECTNTVAIAGGKDLEADPFLRYRAQQWVASLALSQNSAMEVLALSFRDSNNSGLTHARMWNDPDMRGYSELVVDNGTAMAGQTVTIPSRTITLPRLQSDANRYLLYFPAPAVTTPTFYVNGVELPSSDVTVIHEKGIAWIKESPSIDIGYGDDVLISSYECFTGTIDELQTVLNESAIAAGTRVRVVPPTPQPIEISGDMTVVSGTDIRTLRERVALAIQEFLRAIPPGEPLFMYKLIGYLNLIPGVLNIVFDQTDMYPGSTRHKLTVSLENITLR